jgi:hypothetical protein
MVVLSNKKIKMKKKLNLPLLLSVVLVCLFGFVLAMDSWGDTKTAQTTISTTVQEALSLSCGTTAPLGNLIAGTAVTTSSSCSTTTNGAGGYELSVKRDDADTTIDLSTDASTNIPDKTAWTSATPNSYIWSGTGLAFRVVQTGTDSNAYSSTWWGSDDTAPNAKFAGFPNAYDKIAVDTVYSSSASTVVIGYKLDVSAGQKSGAYDGTVTFQSVSKP